LERECATLNGCKLGRCRITKGYDLPSKYVLHTVGPMEEDPESLASCYITTLKQAMKHHLKTVVRFFFKNLTNRLFVEFLLEFMDIQAKELVICLFWLSGNSF
jgi:hypothetical protein